MGSNSDRVVLFISAFFSETPRIVAGATEFVLCAILSAGGVPFLRRGTEPYGVKPGAMKSILSTFRKEEKEDPRTPGGGSWKWNARK